MEAAQFSSFTFHRCDKHRDQKQRDKQRVYWSFQVRDHLEKSEQELKAVARRQELKQRQWRLLTGSCPTDHSACFLKATWVGVTPPTAGWDLPHQPAIRKTPYGLAYQMEIFSQMRFLLPRRRYLLSTDQTKTHRNSTATQTDPAHRGWQVPVQENLTGTKLLLILSMTTSWFSMFKMVSHK